MYLISLGLPPVKEIKPFDDDDDDYDILTSIYTDK